MYGRVLILLLGILCMDECCFKYLYVVLVVIFGLFSLVVGGVVVMMLLLMGLG